MIWICPFRRAALLVLFILAVPCLACLYRVELHLAAEEFQSDWMQAIINSGHFSGDGTAYVGQRFGEGGANDFPAMQGLKYALLLDGSNHVISSSAAGSGQSAFDMRPDYPPLDMLDETKRTRHPQCRFSSDGLLLWAVIPMRRTLYQTAADGSGVAAYVIDAAQFNLRAKAAALRQTALAAVVAVLLLLGYWLYSRAYLKRIDSLVCDLESAVRSGKLSDDNLTKGGAAAVLGNALLRVLDRCAGGRTGAEDERAGLIDTLAELAPVGLFRADANGDYLYVNRRWTEITGMAQGDASGMGWLKSVHPDDSERVSQVWRQCVSARKPFKMECRLASAHGSGQGWVLMQAGCISAETDGSPGFTGTLSDLTEYKESEAEIYRLGYFDLLTGLPNRMLLRDRTEQALVQAHRAGVPVSLLYLDLDEFKAINDTMGHHVGDKLLAGLADRIRNALRDTDMIGRMGGDEFLISLPDTGGDGSAALARKLLAVIQQPLEVEGNSFIVSGSIGISTYPSDGEDYDVLLRNADAAMYRAKSLGKNTYYQFTPDISKSALERIRIATALRGAIQNCELQLVYQPQIRLQSGKVVGVEALLRWRSAVLGEVAPTKFIPVAEEIGMIADIGEWVLRQACGQFVAWQCAGVPPVTIAVNFSPKQFMSPEVLLSSVDGAIAETGIPASRLELEITEGVLMQNVELTIQLLHDLKKRGIRLSADDFGTGYSSLAYLKRFPLDVLKIDRSFIRDIEVDQDDRIIANSVISLGHSMGYAVVAEGVENAAQAAMLREWGCDCGQGYYYGRPMQADEAAHLFAALGTE